MRAILVFALIAVLPVQSWAGNMTERLETRKKIDSAVSAETINAIRNHIDQRLQVIGFDMLAYAEAKKRKIDPNSSLIDRQLAQADQLMSARKFDESFALYQKISNELKKSEHWPVIRDLIFHSMGRALYGAGRFEDAWQVYSWISIRYSAFQQVLFEKMWVAFRLGRVDYALGSIASQRSYYYGEFLNPESYLIETYLYRQLCRTDDLKPVVLEMRRFQKLLEADHWDEWAQTAPETRALWWVSHDETGPEADSIREGLKQRFLADKSKILRQLKLAQAYAFLAESSGSDTGLKPIEKLEDRESWLKRNLEIWPAVYPKNVREEWADEVGSHRFLGDSKCGSAS